MEFEFLWLLKVGLIAVLMCLFATAAFAGETNNADAVKIQTVEQFHSEILANEREISVFLPPDYGQNKTKRYKVLYANDGQDMSALNMQDTLENLYQQNKIETIIVVAICTTADRMNEYGTAGIPNSDGSGAKADKYTAFLLKELMPFINKSYRVLTGPENTVIMGSSLGGLSAFDIAWNHPDVFGKVGTFSGSFWWRRDDKDLATRLNTRIMQETVRKSTKQKGLKMWFEVGTEDETDDRDGDGIIDAIDDLQDLITELEKKNYQKGKHITYVEVQGGQHNQSTWAEVLPQFLQWAFKVGK